MSAALCRRREIVGAGTARRMPLHFHNDAV
jgi:hypothetical protein